MNPEEVTTKQPELMTQINNSLSRLREGVSASQLAEPIPRVTVPEVPPAPGISPSLNSGVRSTLQSVRQTAQGARELQQRQEELADLGGVSAFDISQQMQERFGITPEKLRKLELAESNLAAMEEESKLIEARIQGGAGQTVGQAAREVTQEQREFAVRSAGTAAQVEILRGNIDLARQLANDAVTNALADRQFQSNLLINQINQLQGQVDAESAAALEDEKRQFEESQARIEEIKTAVDSAIASGATTDQEMATLTAVSKPQQPNETVQQYLNRLAQEDAAKLSLAQSIVGRGAAEQRNLEIENLRARNASAWASYTKSQLEINALEQAEVDRQSAIESGQLLPEQVEIIDEVDKEFRAEPIVKEYNEAVARRFAFEEVVKNGVQGVEDLQLVYDFMKSVDPTSVVRETEFATAAKAGNIFEGAYARFNGQFRDGAILPDSVRDSFLNAANAAYEGKQQQYFNVKDQFASKLERRGIQSAGQYLTSYELGAPANQEATLNPDQAQAGQIVEYDGVRYQKLEDGNFKEI